MTDAPPPPLPARHRRRLALGLVVAALAAALVVTWLAFRILLAQWALDAALADLGIAGARGAIAELGFGHAVLEDVELPGIGTVSRVELSFAPDDLLDGRIDGLVLDRPTLLLALDGDGRPSGPLAALAAGDGGGGPPPLDRVAVRNGTIELLFDGEPVTVRLDGTYDFAGYDQGEATWRLESAWGAAYGGADLSGLAAGAPGAIFSFASDALGLPAMAVTALAGRATVEADASLNGRLSMEAAGLSVAGRDLGRLVVTGTWTGLTAAFDIDVGGADDAATARLTAGLAPGADGRRWTVRGLVALARDLVLPLGPPVTLLAPARLELDLAGTPGGAGWPDGSGTLRAELAGAGSALATVGAATLPLRVASEHGTWRLALDGPASISSVRAGPDSAAWLAAGDRALDVTLDADGFAASLRPDGHGGFGVALDLTASAAADDGLSLALRVLGDGDLGPTGLPEHMRMETLDLTASGPLAPGVEAEVLSLTANGDLGPAGWRATATLEARFAALDTHGISARGVQLSLPIELAGDGRDSAALATAPVLLFRAGRLESEGYVAEGVTAELPFALDTVDRGMEAVLSGPGWLEAESIAGPGLRTTAPLLVELEADGLPAFAFGAPDGVRSWESRLVIAPFDAAVALLDREGDVAATVTGTTPGLRVSGSSRLGRLQGTAETHGGDLDIAGPDVSLSGLELLASYNDALSPWPSMQALGLDLADLREPARFASLVLDLAVRPAGPAAEAVRAIVDAHRPPHRYLANLEAAWLPESRRLEGYLRVPPIRFGPELQPADLSPLWGPLLADATGTIELVGEVGMDHGDPYADLRLILGDLGGTLAGAAVEGLAGDIRVTDVAPLRTAPDQVVTARRLDPGLPMENLGMTFTVPGNGALRLAGASLDFAGGEVTAEPTTLDPMRAENRVVLDVSGVDLARLAALADLPELQASGTLSGTIPVLVAGGDIAIEGGRLETREPGVLRYLPEGGKAIAGGDSNVELVVDALANFHYEKLAVDIARELGGASIVGLHIAGANPDLYDGYPVELNVNLTGDLDRIVRDSLAGWRIPDEIRERLSGF